MELTTTSYAILGHLSLRDWAAYDLTKSIRRSTHFFWSRAESQIYAEARRLVKLGLARSRDEADGDRPRTVYGITAKGRRALARWLRTPSSVVTQHFEPLLRVHLARNGRREDLLRAVDEAQEWAEELMRVGAGVAQEFVEGRHLLQEDAAVRGIVFDFLWSQAEAIRDWAERTRTEVESWDGLEPDLASAERGVAVMRAGLDRAEELDLR